MGHPRRVDSKSRSSKAEHVRLQLQSVLRLRPLLKKEKTDQVVLEPRRLEDGKSTAVIHPLLVTPTNHPEAPGMKMLSPEILQLCKDTEYHLSQIIGDESDQEKVHYSLGLPIARESMDFLKYKKGANGVKKSTSLVVCMGVENSGKTHTCLGDIYSVATKRRTSDGLVPRILDSLFSQSKHHVKNRNHLRFAVRMSIVQVAQERTEQPKHGDDSVLQDLLMPALCKKVASPIRSSSPISSIKSVKSFVATLERAKATAISSVTSGSSQTNAQITVEQDIDTLDFYTNAVVKTCHDASEARQVLSTGLQSSQRLLSRRSKAHVLVTFQPVLLASDGSIEREGGKIGVLDMAGIDQASQKKRSTTARRCKDSVGTGTNQNEMAYNALFHCVRALQHNSMILSGKTPKDVELGNDDTSIISGLSDLECANENPKGSMFKTVPYRQHSVTMLLQPFFAASQTTTAKLTLLMAAYPGHRDHAENKALLADLETLHEADREPEQGNAITGFEKESVPPIRYNLSSVSGCQSEDDEQKNKHVYTKKRKPRKDRQKQHPAPSAPAIETSLSISYSMDHDENVVPLPPPFNPSAPPANPSAPPLSVVTSPGADGSNQALAVDFPGVAMPASNVHESQFAAPRAVMPNPQNRERIVYERSYERKLNSIQSSGTRTDRISEDHPFRASTVHNIQEQPKATTKPETSPTKAWLSGLSGTTKNAINYAVHASAKKGMKMVDKMRTTPERADTSTATYTNGNLHDYPRTPSETDKTMNETHMKSSKLGTVVQLSTKTGASSPMKSPKSKGGTSVAAHKRLQRLENEYKALAKRNKALESRCSALSVENTELKHCLAENGTKEWTKEEEEEWQKTRKKYAAPPLIQSPLRKHLIETQQVFETTGRYNFEIGKPQFTLQYPGYFQRASDLDLRDKRDEEEAMQNLNQILKPKEDTTEKETNTPGSGEKRKSKLHEFQRRLEQAKRRKSSLINKSKQHT